MGKQFLPVSKMELIKPRRLKPGDTIGVAAPASPFRRRVLNQGLTLLKEMGYAVKLADGLFEAKGYLAGSDAHRASQLQAMFLDDGVDAVMCARGGFGSMRILPYLDWEMIRAHPKPFIGFSDITAIHQALLLRAGLTTFHGPVVCSLPASDRQTRLSLNRAITSEAPLSLKAARPRTIKSGRADGVLVGGNLTTLCHLVGTPFQRGFAGAILFIEDTGEAAYRIDRMLMHLKLAGCFDGMAGLVAGTFKDCARAAIVDNLLRQRFVDQEVPILSGMAFGHGRRNVTLPVGIAVRLDADSGRLDLLECATVD